MKSDWFIAIRTETIVEKEVTDDNGTLWKKTIVNWLKWNVWWRFVSRSKAALIEIFSTHSFKIKESNLTNWYSTNRNQRPFKLNFHKKCSVYRLVLFFYIEICFFNLVGSKSTVFHRKFFVWHIKKELTTYEVKKQQKISENKTVWMRKIKKSERNGQIKTAVKSIRRAHVFM